MQVLSPKIPELNITVSANWFLAPLGMASPRPRMGAKAGTKVGGQHYLVTQQGCPLRPHVAMETSPPGIRGQRQDFRLGSQQFPDPEGTLDKTLPPQADGRGTQGGPSLLRAGTSLGSWDPRLQPLEGVSRRRELAHHCRGWEVWGAGAAASSTLLAPSICPFGIGRLCRPLELCPTPQDPLSANPHT